MQGNQPSQGFLVTYADGASITFVQSLSDTLTFSKVSGPAWLSVDANGALSGTPASSGDSTPERRPKPASRPARA